MLKKSLQALDLFPFEIKLNFRRKPNFHTIFGEILSIIVLILLFLIGYKSSLDMLEYSNPEINIFEKKNTEVNMFNITSMVPNINSTNYFKIFSVDKINDTEKFIHQNFEIQLTLINFETNLDSFFLYKNIENIKILETKNIKDNLNSMVNNAEYINIVYSYEFTISFQINFNKNSIFIYKNDTSKTINLQNLYLNHNSFIKIATKFSNLENKSYSIRLIDKKINMKLNDNIIEPYLKEFYSETEYKLNYRKQGYDIIYQYIELNDDKNFVRSSYEKKYVFQLFYCGNIPVEDDDEIDVIKFIVNNKMKVYFRKYKKFQSVLAEIGGIFNIFILVGKFLVYPFNKLKFDVKVINKLFSVDQVTLNEKRQMNINLKKEIEVSEIQIDKRLNILSNIDKKDSQIEDFIFNDSERKINKSSHSSDKIDSLNILKNSSISEIKYKKYTHTDENKLNSKKIETNNINYTKINNENREKFDKFSLEFLKKKLIVLYKNRSLLRKNYKSINLTNFDVFRIVVCKKRNKIKKINNAMEIHSIAERKINGYLNSLRLMKLQENFEKLKYLILNEHQCFSFSVMKGIHYKDIKNDKLEKGFKFLEYMVKDNLNRDKNEKEINCKIIRLLVDDVVELLK